MCGIAGMIHLEYNDSVVDKMMESMKRRGPDEGGIYKNDDVCLMHQRLTIIDPVNGKQPIIFTDNNETYIMVYNGELYNTEDIRNDLTHLGHVFAGHSDTEVLIHAYAQWSGECVHRLNGIYGFAVWEKNGKRLFVARDRMGVKPFFFSQKGSGFFFASELKTILAHPDFSPQLDGNGIAELLLIGPGRTPGCGVLKDICELKPGWCGYFENNSLKLNRYWKLTDREHTENFEQTVEYVRYLVVDAIKRQMVSDVPIGTFLSGGLDSSIISSVCAKAYAEQGYTLPTFSVGYVNNEKYFTPGKFQPNSDESFIQIMSGYLNTNHKKVQLGAPELVNALIDATKARDLPGMADVDASLLLFCGEIRKDVKVALSGECADEIFGGYPWYRDTEVRSAAGFPWSQNTEYRFSFLKKGLLNRESALEYVNARYQTTIDDCDILPGISAAERRMKEMVNLNINWFMQTLLDRKDRMSMYNSLEVRVPFCDHRIASYLYSVPWEFKDYNGQEKGLLRYAMRDYLPDEILTRRKSPYPKTFDPKYTELVSRMLWELIENHNEPIHKIVNKDALLCLIYDEQPWPWYGQLMKTPQTIAYMLQLNCWLKEYNVNIDV